MKSVIFVLLISVVLVISGCETRGKGTNIGGVDMEFSKDQPPLGSIQDNQAFSVVLTLTNSLTNEVSDAKLCVSDLLLEAEGGISGKPCQTVILRAAENLDGKIIPSVSEKISFPENGGTYAYHAGELGSDSTTISAELTYTVDSTVVLKGVCFKRKSDIDTGDSLCESEEVFVGEDIVADPAPISITKVEKNIYPEGTDNTIKLTLYLTKTDGEVIWGEDETRNLMSIDISSSDAQEFICSPSEDGLINFDKPTEKIICQSKFSLSQDFYMGTININLNYKYKSKLSSGPITIEKGVSLS